MSTKQLSGFMLGVCASTGVLASTCTPGYYDPLNGSNCIPAPIGRYVAAAGATQATLAPAGYYVATTGSSEPTPAPLGSYVSDMGASSATLAPAGYYVDTTGAIAATPAPVGYYVPTTGATTAIAAPLGYYVATQGASSPTPVGPGYYTATTASSSPIGGGMIASTINLALSATHDLLSTQQGMIESGKEGFDLTVKSSLGKVNQVGLGASNQQGIRINSILMQHRSGTRVEDWQIFGGLSDQKLDSIAAGSGSGRTWILGVGRGFDSGNGGVIGASVFAGQTTSSVTRQVTETSVAETQTHDGNIRILGVKLVAGLPMQILHGRLLLEGGVNYFEQAAVSETATTSATTAALSLNKTHFSTMPVFVGVEHTLPNTRFQWGVQSDLSPQRQLTVSLLNDASYKFFVPVQGTSTTAAVIKIRFDALPLNNGINLDGGVQIEAGPNIKRQEVQVRLFKRW